MENELEEITLEEVNKLAEQGKVKFLGVSLIRERLGYWGDRTYFPEDYKLRRGSRDNADTLEKACSDYRLDGSTHRHLGKETEVHTHYGESAVSGKSCIIEKITEWPVSYFQIRE